MTHPAHDHRHHHNAVSSSTKDSKYSKFFTYWVAPFSGGVDEWEAQIKSTCTVPINVNPTFATTWRNDHLSFWYLAYDHRQHDGTVKTSNGISARKEPGDSRKVADFVV